MALVTSHIMSSPRSGGVHCDNMLSVQPEVSSMARLPRNQHQFSSISETEHAEGSSPVLVLCIHHLCVPFFMHPKGLSLGGSLL